MRSWLAYLLVLGVLFIAAISFAEISIRSTACMACHQQEASFVKWMGERLKAQKKGFSHELIACADCHIAGSPEGSITSRLRSLLHTVTYLVPQIDPRKPEISGMFNRTRVPSENCQFCHYASVYRKAVYIKDLPNKLREIGLIMDHRKHALARANTCAKCHERFKNPLDLAADRTVNYAEVNHLSCDSCHSFASHDYRSGHLLPMTEDNFSRARKEAWNRMSANPRWMVPIPAERTCRRCHNGKIHYKAKIFDADCRTGSNFENCLKCHPIMTKDYFDKYLRERPLTTVETQPASPASDQGTGALGEAREYSGMSWLLGSFSVNLREVRSR